jgi:hypothetical protein
MIFSKTAIEQGHKKEFLIVDKLKTHTHTHTDRNIF